MSNFSMNATKDVSDSETQATLEALQAQIRSNYRPPGPSTGVTVSDNGQQPAPPPSAFAMEFVRNHDGTILMDHKGVPITIARILATKPLRHELSTRPGPGNKKLTYISGDGVTRTLNDVFGFDGWNLNIVKTEREHCEKDDNGKYYVVFRATVRVTHAKTGIHKEDAGAGDATDRNLGTAIANALKASITDAMKRAARHFGEKLGNCTWHTCSCTGVDCRAFRVEECHLWIDGHTLITTMLSLSLCVFPPQLSTLETSTSTRLQRRFRKRSISPKLNVPTTNSAFRRIKSRLLLLRMLLLLRLMCLFSNSNQLSDNLRRCRLHVPWSHSRHLLIIIIIILVVQRLNNTMLELLLGRAAWQRPIP
jgi:DNA repair and recombination protein RAD52